MDWNCVHQMSMISLTPSCFQISLPVPLLCLWQFFMVVMTSSVSSASSWNQHTHVFVSSTSPELFLPNWHCIQVTKPTEPQLSLFPSHPINIAHHSPFLHVKLLYSHGFQAPHCWVFLCFALVSSIPWPPSTDVPQNSVRFSAFLHTFAPLVRASSLWS